MYLAVRRAAGFCLSPVRARARKQQNLRNLGTTLGSPFESSKVSPPPSPLPEIFVPPRRGFLLRAVHARLSLMGRDFSLRKFFHFFSPVFFFLFFSFFTRSNSKQRRDVEKLTIRRTRGLMALGIESHVSGRRSSRYFGISCFLRRVLSINKLFRNRASYGGL